KPAFTRNRLSSVPVMLERVSQRYTAVHPLASDPGPQGLGIDAERLAIQADGGQRIAPGPQALHLATAHREESGDVVEGEQGGGRGGRAPLASGGGRRRANPQRPTPRPAPRGGGGVWPPPGSRRAPPQPGQVTRVPPKTENASATVLMPAAVPSRGRTTPPRGS